MSEQVENLAALCDEMRARAIVEKGEANGRDVWALLEAGASAIDKLLAEASPTENASLKPRRDLDAIELMAQQVGTKLLAKAADALPYGARQTEIFLRQGPSIVLSLVAALRDASKGES